MHVCVSMCVCTYMYMYVYVCVWIEHSLLRAHLKLSTIEFPISVCLSVGVSISTLFIVTHFLLLKTFLFLQDSNLAGLH